MGRLHEEYSEAVAATSREWAPWYVIPADSKAWMRVAVAETIVETLKSLDLEYPKVADEDRARFEEIRERLK